MKRLLSSTVTELLAMNKKEKLLAIQSSEGRTMLVEVTCEGAPDALENSSMAELYAAFGADILLLNKFDVFQPSIQRIDVDHAEDCIKTLRKYTGKYVGINLEPVPAENTMQVEQIELSRGRLATKETALQAKKLGVDLITLTGNPDTGVTNEEIIKATAVMKETVGDDMIIIAGKMHAAGSLKEAGPNLISKDVIARLVEAGADIILLPAPGTVPGITLDYVWDLVNYCHSLGVMTLTTVGTSQEEAEKETMQQLALMCKMSGTDLHHIGDAGHAGCTAENIMTYSIAIRGKRHTYNRLATSVYR